MRPKFLTAGRPAGFDWGQLALLVWTIVLLVVCIRTAIQPRTRSLFFTWASAGADWSNGKNLYFHDQWPNELDQFRYSPLIAVSFTPLSLLNERVGNVVWRLFNAGVFLGGFWWWLRNMLPGEGTNPLRSLALLMVVPLSLASLSNGQTNPLVIGFLLAATAALNEKRWNLSALFITLACALKLYPIAVGLLLVLVYPRQLSWRLALVLALAAVVPFCFQRPAYVLDQYQQWYRLLGRDDRRNFPLSIAYRDLWLLFRVWNEHLPTAWTIPITGKIYLGLQLALAGVCAAVCVAAHWLGVSKARQLTTALMLGCCWMTLCGPATESSSFVQIGPALTWALLAGRREGWPLAVRLLPVCASSLLLTGVFAGLTPYTGQIHGFGLQPLATALLFVVYLTVAVRAMWVAKNNAELPGQSLTARAA